MKTARFQSASRSKLAKAANLDNDSERSKSSRFAKSDRPGRNSRHPSGALPPGYGPFLEDLKSRIQAARVKAAISVNRELIALYWYIGKSIVQRQRAEGWGKSVVDRLAADIQREFPGIAGFSPANVWRMRAFYLAWTDEVLAHGARESGKTNLARAARDLDGRNLPQAVAEIPWFHNVAIMEKLKSPAERLWYVRKTVEHGWSRAVLIQQIETGLFRRQGRAVTNFSRTLLPPQSDLAQQTLKDPYVFDFLTIGEEAREQDLERGLLGHIRKFLLELGVGFAFVGSQVHLEVEGDDFYLDLLFYHLRLRCFVVIDLKMEAFKPEFAGKMNFYLSAVDAQLRHAADQPSIGIILCKTRKRLIAEYALRNTRTPIGVSEYTLTRIVPSELKSSLPSVQELETWLADIGEKKE
jgi:predicted nuclease of restriction endonuclease-like (RecB) superfamily